MRVIETPEEKRTRQALDFIVAQKKQETKKVFNSSSSERRTKSAWKFLFDNSTRNSSSSDLDIDTSGPLILKEERQENVRYLPID